MRAIDMQTVLFSKEKGPMLKDSEMLAQLTSAFKSPGEVFKSEQELVDDLRRFDVKIVIMSGTWRRFGWEDWGELRDRHDYLGYLKKTYPDVILGFWVCTDADRGIKAIHEAERCIKDLGSYGIAVCGSISGIPANDKLFYHFYDLCREADVPVKIWVGHIAAQDQGFRLSTEVPVPNIDDVACQFPDLKIVGAHMPWPYHDQMVSLCLHYSNVYNEVHGWSPKYFPETFKRDIRTRLQDKIMFGSDYSFFTYERLFADWEAEGYKPEVLRKVFYENAQKVLGLSI